MDYEGLKRSEKRTIDIALSMEGGYVLDFSNRTIDEHFEDEFGIDFYAELFSINGSSKANRLRTILGSLEGVIAASVLRKLWDRRSTLPRQYRADNPKQEDEIRNSFFMILAKLEGDSRQSDLGALHAFEASETLDQLLNSMERDIRADAHQAALDHLHTYCQKKFRNLIEARGGTVTNKEPLHSRCGRYCKILESDGTCSEMSIRIMKNSISIFEKFNDVRNDRSLAHDNSVLGSQEARFVFDSVCAVLRFIKSTDTTFGS